MDNRSEELNLDTTFSNPVRETTLAEGVCISAPPANPYQAAAHELRATLERAIGGAVDVVPDGETPTDGRHVIALGNMMDNAFLRELYFQGYDMTDHAWPGPGGRVVRTVPHSVEGVGHVVVVGVSGASHRNLSPPCGCGGGRG